MRGRIAGGRFFYEGGVNLVSASRETRWYHYWFFCYVHYCSDSQCFSLGRQNPPKLPLSLGDLGPPESTLQSAYWSVQQFMQGSRTWSTDRQTYRHTYRPHYSVCNNRRHLAIAVHTTTFHTFTADVVVSSEFMLLQLQTQLWSNLPGWRPSNQQWPTWQVLVSLVGVMLAMRWNSSAGSSILSRLSISSSLCCSSSVGQNPSHSQFNTDIWFWLSPACYDTHTILTFIKIYSISVPIRALMLSVWDSTASWL